MCAFVEFLLNLRVLRTPHRGSRRFELHTLLIPLHVLKRLMPPFSKGISNPFWVLWSQYFKSNYGRNRSSSGLWRILDIKWFFGPSVLHTILHRRGRVHPIAARQFLLIPSRVRARI